MNIFDAVKQNNLDAVKDYIKEGVNVNAMDRTDLSPLHWAAYHGYTKIAKLLIKNKANVNLNNTYEVTPMHFAVVQGHTEIVKLLKQHGAHEAIDKNSKEENSEQDNISNQLETLNSNVAKIVDELESISNSLEDIAILFKTARMENSTEYEDIF